MIALKPYLEYKESGQAWVGAIPQHWSVLPNRALFEEVKDRDHPHEQMLSVTITKGVIRQKALLAASSKKDSSNLDKSAYKLVQPNDIAYNKMRAWQGAIGVSDLRGIISPAYVVMRRRDGSDPHYFHHLFRSPGFAKEAERWSYGITSDMWSLRPEHFRMIYSPLPSADEQVAIARFLDHTNRRIGRFIRGKKKVIALLEEQKLATIHHAVTRGLDSSVRLKPSGVEWLGDIPERWEVKPMRVFCSYISYGFTNPMPTSDEGPYMLTANDIGYGNIRYESARRTTQDAYDRSLTKKSRPVLGDVLITKDGTLGRVAVSDGRPACINQSIALLRLDNSKVDPEFLVAALQSPLYQERMRFDAGGTTIKHIYITRLAKMRMAIPSVDDQKTILPSLNVALGALNRVESAVQLEIDFVCEYRKRLIADVVSGKLDVREAVRNLPAETEDLAIDEEEGLEETQIVEEEQIA